MLACTIKVLNLVNKKLLLCFLLCKFLQGKSSFPSWPSKQELFANLQIPKYTHACTHARTYIHTHLHWLLGIPGCWSILLDCRTSLLCIDPAFLRWGGFLDCGRRTEDSAIFSWSSDTFAMPATCRYSGMICWGESQVTMDHTVIMLVYFCMSILQIWGTGKVCMCVYI